ncbi:MAG: DNA polymerase III subunit gamma/tau [Ruminococcaceae bacterium]|nr:DNA polymerase III subunit gamma/tau [Oscillospiraceae bacterium]
MGYQALYRKWRPSTFSEIVGQEHITATLQNEIKSGKIAQAYLFCGSRGTGKTTTARVFSKAVNCLQPENGNPCNRCKVCQGIADGSLMDVAEIDAASNNSVETIRTINSEVSYLPSGMKYKIYIIDEVHMLSVSAFNALLKTLEEPPSHVIFILATTESHKIPATILSRCQRFDFKRISQNPMLERLKIVAQNDGIRITDNALSLIMKSADGSMRDALSLLDQCSSGCADEIDADWVRTVTGGPESSRMLALGGAILNYETEQVFLQIKDAFAKGFDAIRLLESLLEYFRNLIVCKSSGAPAELIELSPSELETLSLQAEGVTMARCLTAMDVLSKAYDNTRWAKNTRLILEMALIQLSHPKAEESNLLARVERLEALSQGERIPEPKKVPVPEVKEPVQSAPAPKNPVEEKPTMQEPVVQPSVAQSQPTGNTSSVADCWTDIVHEIERQGNPLLSGALRSGEFRIKGNELYLLGLLPMIDTPQNKMAIKKAVKEICNTDMEVVIVALGQSIPEEPQSRPSEPDRLQELAQHLSNKINIIS